MTNCRFLLAAITTLLGAVCLFGACTTEVDYSMGEEFVPEGQHMELRRRVYKGGRVSDGGVDMGEMSISSTRLYITDSIESSNLDYLYFGSENSDTYGRRRAGFMTQMVCNMSLDEEHGWGYRPIFDSLRMSLYIKDYHGDTTIKQRFNVYEITSNKYFEMSKESEDTTFYINFDPKPFISEEPIFTFVFPNQEKGVYVGNISNPVGSDVLLEPTGAATEDYVRRLMLMTSMDENDGYAVDSEGIYDDGNEKLFVEHIRGLYIEPAEGSEGAMFASDIEETGLILYSRNRYEADPTIIKDTVIMGYNFYVNPNFFDINAGNVSIATVSHDFTGVAGIDEEAIDSSLGIDEREVVLTGYVDGMGGVVTEVTFSDELIQSLADIVLSHDDSTISVNQALLSIYVEGSEYDYRAINSATISPLLDAAMTRMGLYTDYAKKIAVTDYAYTAESNVTLAYDGYLNRSLACYTMDISNYIQSLMIAAADNLTEDGKSVNLDIFSEEYEPEAESLISHRRFYIGPEAYGYFGFDRQRIIGGDEAVGGIKNSAPITLDITYTIVN